MWHFTPLGFFSVVCARQDPGRPSQPVDPSRRMIRVRLLRHLENLQASFPDLLAEFEVLQSSSSDYQARMIVPTETWLEVARRLEEGVDYDNFKSEAHKLRDSEYDSWLGAVWGVGMRHQQREAPNSARSLYSAPVGQPDLGYEGAADDEWEEEPFEDVEPMFVEVDEFDPLREADRDRLQTATMLTSGVREPFVDPVYVVYEDVEDDAPIFAVTASSDTVLRALVTIGVRFGFAPTMLAGDELAVYGPYNDLEEHCEAYGMRPLSIPLLDPANLPKLSKEAPVKEKPTPTGRVISAGIKAESGPAQAGNKPGGQPATPLVEDTSVAGGLDDDGRPVIAPKRTDGTVDESVTPTDPQESSK